MRIRSTNIDFGRAAVNRVASGKAVMVALPEVEMNVMHMGPVRYILSELTITGY